MKKKMAAVVAVTIAAAALGVGLQSGSTTLAAAVEEYVGGFEVGGISYEIIRQTENEAEIIVYLEIVENDKYKKVPMEDLILGKDDSGNWGIMKATNIFIPPEENEEPEPTPDKKDTSWWSDPVICAPAMQAMIDYMDENVLDSPGIFRNEPNISSGWGPYDREDNVVIVKGWMIYGTTSDIKEIEWTAMIDLNIYEVTWEWLT